MGRIAPGACVYAPDSKARCAAVHHTGFTGIPQVDGYRGYRTLAEKSGVTLAFSWAYVRSLA
ncbi:transposase [Aminobacter sp. J41]|uniref:IS66 family transposase n=2 Tax=unclassified Aminobacter TaxID=2644704 RepID=UPI000466F8BC